MLPRVPLVLAVFLVTVGVTNAAEFTNSAKGYKLSYPDGWQVDDYGGMTSSIEIMSPGFRAVQTRGMVEGACISVSPFLPSTFRSDRTDDDYLREWATGKRVIGRTAATKGHPATVTYAGKGSNERTMMVIRHVDNRTFVLSLNWFVQDARAQEYKRAFTQVTNSMSLAPVVLPTPLPTPSWREIHECSCEAITCEDGESDPGCSVSCSEGTRATCMCAQCKYDSVDKVTELLTYDGCECNPEEEATPTPGVQSDLTADH